MSELKPITRTPEWERHTRRLHSLSRIAESIGKELVKASGTRNGDPVFREWLLELGRLNTDLLKRDRQSFVDFADTYGTGGA